MFVNACLGARPCYFAPMSQSSNTAQSKSEQFSVLTQLLNEGVEEGVFPGAVSVIGLNGNPIYQHATGSKILKATRGEANPPMSIDTVFDVAGLTSILITGLLLLRLTQEGKISLDDRVSRYLQGFGVHGKSKITVGQLLNHTSGLIAWAPFFEEILQENTGARLGIMTSRSARDYVYNQIQRLPLKFEPGVKQLYSDLGPLLIGAIIELLTGLGLERVAQKLIIQPLGLKSTGYVDLSMIRRRGIHPVADAIAATEECQWRKRVLCGEVHDDNAWAMGGIAGHAGLFTNIIDTQRIIAELMASYRGESGFLAQSLIRGVWETQFENSTFRAGWETPTRENGMIDTGLSQNAVGMNGFTGCSIWLEPSKGLNITLFTNRIHPSRSNKKINAFRTEFHAAAMKAIGA